MYVHIAIYKWKPDALRDDIDGALAKVRSVTDRVAGLKAIYCGVNTSKWNQGFMDGIVVIGETQEAIDAYRADDVHEEAARLIEGMELDGIGIDFVDSE